MPLLVVAFQVEDGNGQILHLIQYRVTWFCLNLLCHSTLCCSNTTAKEGKPPPCFRKMLSLCSYMLESALWVAKHRLLLLTGLFRTGSTRITHFHTGWGSRGAAQVAAGTRGILRRPRNVSRKIALCVQGFRESHTTNISNLTKERHCKILRHNHWLIKQTTGKEI